jgi:hypothetical protein
MKSDDLDLVFTTNTNLICEAVGCHAKATNKVEAKVGSGTIFLFLCDMCTPKFTTGKGLE